MNDIVRDKFIIFLSLNYYLQISICISIRPGPKVFTTAVNMSFIIKISENDWIREFGFIQRLIH